MDQFFKRGRHTYIDTKFILVCAIISLIISILLIVLGLILKKRRQGKSTSGWICIGVGAVGFLYNLVQIILRL